MNHFKVYGELIDRAKTRQSCPNSALTPAQSETHHIVPKSLGGPDTDDNLVDLTLREHYIAHKLLERIYRQTGPRESHAKMVAALWFMSNRCKGLVSSHSYQTARLQYAERYGTTRGQKFYNNGVEERLEPAEFATSLGPEWKLGRLKRRWWRHELTGRTTLCPQWPGEGWAPGRKAR